MAPTYTPAVGDVVLLREPGIGDNGLNDGPAAAMVTKVWSDSLVNLIVFPSGLSPTVRTSVPRSVKDGAPGWLPR